MFFLSLFSTFVFAESTSDSIVLIFDVSLGGKDIGKHTVQLKYLPTDKFNPEGVRLVESEVELSLVIGGRERIHHQKSSATFTGKRGRFISAISSDGLSIELQGGKQPDGRWSIYSIEPEGTKNHVYSIPEVSTITTAIFDPEQSLQHTEGVLGGIFSVETGDVLISSWSNAVETKMEIAGVVTTGHSRVVSNRDFQLTLFWNMEGLLLDWDLVYAGIHLDANLREIPEGLQFGEIHSVRSFEGVEGEPL
jgi:hypothetical protein